MYEFPVKKEPVPPASPPLPGTDYRCRMYAAGLIGVRAGGARRAAAPPKVWATQIFWAARENLGKASF